MNKQKKAANAALLARCSEELAQAEAINAGKPGCTGDSGVLRAAVARKKKDVALSNASSGTEIDLDWAQWNQDHKKGPRQPAQQPDPTGAIAGYTGPKMNDNTINAIKNFQKATGLPVTGNLDPNTLDKAKKYPAQVAAAKAATKAGNAATAAQKKKDAAEKKAAAAKTKAEKAATAATKKKAAADTKAQKAQETTAKKSAAQAAKDAKAKAKSDAATAKAGKGVSSGNITVSSSGVTRNG